MKSIVEELSPYQYKMNIANLKLTNAISNFYKKNELDEVNMTDLQKKERHEKMWTSTPEDPLFVFMGYKARMEFNKALEEELNK